jgi:hypothetical protein
MKAKAASYSVLIVLSLILALLAVPGSSYAGTPVGTVCFVDDFGSNWWLDFGDTGSGLNFDVHGFRVGTEACNGTFVQPVSGTATFDGSTVVAFGVWSIATGPGDTCISSSWHGVVDLTTFQAQGFYMTQQAFEDSFQLFEIDCNVVLQAAKKK